MEGIGAEEPPPHSPRAQALMGRNQTVRSLPQVALLSGAESGDMVHSGTPGNIGTEVKNSTGRGVKNSQGYSSLDEFPSM